MNETLTEEQFERVADETLRAMNGAIDALGADLEADLESGILTLEFSDGVKYVINSHRAAKQIWMAAERSAWHFDYLPSTTKWIAAKTGDELWGTVEGVIQRKLGSPVSLKR